MALDDEELLRLALDEEPISAGSLKHLEQCALCQQRLARYKSVNEFFLSRLYRSQCPTATELNEYCAGILSTDNAMIVAQHIQECPLCASEVADIRRTLASFEPFPGVNDFSPRDLIERIIANLVPWQPQLVTRSAVSETSWPRQYRAGALNISLHLSRSSIGETMLLGLLSSDDPAESTEDFEGIDVELYSVPGSSAAEPGQQNGHTMHPLLVSQVDDLGNIVFKPVPSGQYMLLMHMPEQEIVIEGLTIDHR